MRNGPIKVVLINAGKYDYAEVELDGALQIVGQNNTGKTTLINTLQFLYIDDMRRMDFGSYSLEQTLGYYFPNQYSYVLFECRTLRGQAVIGWRGSSRASAAGPERFFYLGPYRREDYFTDDGQVREARAVIARLTLHDYHALHKAQLHRELLLAGMGEHGAGLGIISLKDNDKFHQFRETLKNLLSLSSISQDQMRDRLLMLADIQPDAVAIDAQRVLGEDHDEILRRKEELALLKRHEGIIRSLLDKYDTRQTVRGELKFRWSDVKRRKEDFQREHAEHLATLEKDLTTSQSLEIEFTGKLAKKRDERDGFKGDEAVLLKELDELRTTTKEFLNFIPEFEQAALAQIEQQIVTKQSQLNHAAMERLEEVKEQRSDLAETITAREAAVRRFGQLVVTALRKEFDDKELARVFAVLSPELLEQRIAPDSLTILDRSAALAAVRQILQRTTDGIYQDENVRLHIKPVRRVLERLESVEKLEADLERLRRDEQRLAKLQEAIEQREKIESELAQLKSQQTEKHDVLTRYQQLQKLRQSEPDWTRNLKETSEAIAALDNEIGTLDKSLRETRDRQTHLANQRRESERQFDEVMQRFSRCRHPIFEAAMSASADIPDDFDMAIARYLREQQREEEVSRNVETLFAKMQSVFADRFDGVDEAATIRNLTEEMEALPDREEALKRDWNAHLHGLKSHFKQVLDELQSVHSAKDRLNRSFTDVRISDLKAIKLTVEPQAYEISLIRRLAEIEELDLYGDHKPLETAVNNMRQWLEKAPIIRFADLFTLGVSVTGGDDKVKHYRDFRQIESDGTTVTIKVLFNLLVLKSLLHKDDVSVPFFLDEVEKLDSANRHAVLQTSRSLGFIALTASPNAVGEVDSLYFLEPRRGRVVLNQNHRISIQLKPAAATTP